MKVGVRGSETQKIVATSVSTKNQGAGVSSTQ